MYKCGVGNGGLQDMKRFNNRMRHEFGGEKKWTSGKWIPASFFETWWWPLTVEGWGGVGHSTSASANAASPLSRIR